MLGRWRLRSSAQFDPLFGETKPEVKATITKETSTTAEQLPSLVFIGDSLGRRQLNSTIAVTVSELFNAGPKEWEGARFIDSIEQDRPSPFLECFDHLTLQSRFWLVCSLHSNDNMIYEIKATVNSCIALSSSAKAVNFSSHAHFRAAQSPTALLALACR